MTNAPASHPDLSPGRHRVGRACTCILHGGTFLLAPTRSGRWTFPGGSGEPHETPAEAAEAAVREAWEETGAHLVRHGDAFPIVSARGDVTACFAATVLRFEPSPEGRPRPWIDPLDHEWRDDDPVQAALPVPRARGLL